MATSLAHAGRPTARNAVTIAARVGYAAKGVVYFLIGGLALLTAFGEGGATTDGGGVLRWVAQQAFGKLLLGALGCGLILYALWRFAQAAVDPENEADGRKGVARRLGWAISGLSHAALGVLAFRIVADSDSTSSSRASYGAEVLSWPGGKLLLIALGLVVVGFGLHQLYQAWTAKLDEHLDLGSMGATARTAAVRAARAGLAARGVVFAVMGGFVVRAGLQSQAGEIKGIGAALDYLRSRSYGTLLLAVVAAGLLLYGIYQLIMARYRRIEV